MSIELFLYLADVSGSLKELFQIVTIVSALVGAFSLIPIYVEKMGSDLFRKLYPFALIAWVVGFGLLGALTPTKQTIYMMAGATVAKEALNSTVGQKVQQAIEDQLDEFLKKAEKKK